MYVYIYIYIYIYMCTTMTNRWPSYLRIIVQLLAIWSSPPRNASPGWNQQGEWILGGDTLLEKKTSLYSEHIHGSHSKKGRYPPVIKYGQWKMDHLSLIFLFKPPFIGNFPASHCWIPEGKGSEQYWTISFCTYEISHSNPLICQRQEMQKMRKKQVVCNGIAFLHLWLLIIYISIQLHHVLMLTIS